jgi:hypothetical protein
VFAPLTRRDLEKPRTAPYGDNWMLLTEDREVSVTSTCSNGKPS